MHHCVAIHADGVAAGGTYVYRVLAPVRATLAIVKVGHGWICKEMRGVSNARIPPAIQKRVLDVLLATESGAALEIEVEPATRSACLSFWELRRNEEQVAALSPEDLSFYQRCLAAFENPRTLWRKGQGGKSQCR